MWQTKDGSADLTSSVYTLRPLMIDIQQFYSLILTLVLIFIILTYETCSLYMHDRSFN